MKKTVISLIVALSLFSFIPRSSAATSAYPATGWCAVFMGTFNGSPVTLNMGYNAYNSTCQIVGYTMYNGTFSMAGSGLEEIATRKVVKSNGMYLGVNNHTQRALPTEMSAGIGASLAIGIGFGIGDATHTISGQGTLNVTGVLLDYWIASGTRAGATDTVWLEKTSGMLLRLFTAAPSGTMNVTMIAATNVIPPKAAGVYEFPGSAWGGMYAGSFMGYPVAVNMGYTRTTMVLEKVPSLVLVPAFTLFNESISMVGSGVENMTTRKLEGKTYGTYLGSDNHTQHALPAEMSAGIGASIVIGIGFGVGDANHIITGQGTMTVTGVSIDYWIAKGTRAGSNQTVWLEKTTGMLLRLTINSTIGSMDVTMISATNIIPPSTSTPPISGYEAWALLTGTSVAILVLWRFRKHRA